MEPSPAKNFLAQDEGGFARGGCFHRTSPSARAQRCLRAVDHERRRKPDPLFPSSEPVKLTQTSQATGSGETELPASLDCQGTARALSVQTGESGHCNMEIQTLLGFPDKRTRVYKKQQTKISVVETAFLVKQFVLTEHFSFQ